MPRKRSPSSSSSSSSSSSDSSSGSDGDWRRRMSKNISIVAAAKASAQRIAAAPLNSTAADEVSWEPVLETDDDHEYIREFNNKHAAVRSGQVVFFGDSDIEYWPGVEASLGAINCGVGGSEAMHHAFFVSRFLNKYRPSLVIMCGGENDMAGERSARETARAAQFALDKILSFGAPVVFFSPKYEPDTTELQEKYCEYNKLMSTWAGTRESLVYVDTLEAFCVERRAPQESFFRSDGLHLNYDGYGTVWLPKLQLALTKIPHRHTFKSFRKRVDAAVLSARRYRWACPKCHVPCDNPFECQDDDGCGCCDCDSSCKQKLRLR